MRIKVPRGIGKDQIYIVLILGSITGFYNWNTLLKDHMKEREKELQLNEVINSKCWSSHNLYVDCINRICDYMT